MPELPEVETIANDLRQARLTGRRIQEVRVFWPKSIANLTPEDFITLLRGQTIIGIDRRGKFLILHLSNRKTLLVHLRMTGRFSFEKKGKNPSVHEHLVLQFTDGWELRYHDTRKFGRWYLVADIAEVIGRLGPEPLNEKFGAREFYVQLKKHQRQLKPLLLDQHFIAGLGNIYVDEALWEAQLHPQSLSSQLTQKQAQNLLESIRFVLRRGMETQGTTLGQGKSNYYRLSGARGEHQNTLSVFRKTGQPCPRCGTPVERLKVSQRSTHICPKCQKRVSSQINNRKSEARSQNSE